MLNYTLSKIFLSYAIRRLFYSKMNFLRLKFLSRLMNVYHLSDSKMTQLLETKNKVKQGRYKWI